MHGQLEYLALQVPQRQIECAQGIFFFTPRRIEERARHVLPEPLDMLRVLPDQPPRALFQRVDESAFANAGDTGVGFDRHHGIGLVKQRIGRGRRVGAHPRDLHLRQRSLHQRQMRECGHARRHRPEK